MILSFENERAIAHLPKLGQPMSTSRDSLQHDEQITYILTPSLNLSSIAADDEEREREKCRCKSCLCVCVPVHCQC